MSNLKKMKNILIISFFFLCVLIFALWLFSKISVETQRESLRIAKNLLLQSKTKAASKYQDCLHRCDVNGVERCIFPLILQKELVVVEKKTEAIKFADSLLHVPLKKEAKNIENEPIIEQNDTFDFVTDLGKKDQNGLDYFDVIVKSERIMLKNTYGYDSAAVAAEIELFSKLSRDEFYVKYFNASYGFCSKIDFQIGLCAVMARFYENFAFFIEHLVKNPVVRITPPVPIEDIF